ncbi:amidohydrolase family protein [Ideonella sp. DXS22W]|uniref:Amidohydrolase family protein n=1 Tax=Pseudaquabacterium inlustre TaxID=2984192 RepID=A0ABU9CLY9_9BURK
MRATREPGQAWLSCDSHMHIYDGRYPAVAGARLTPRDALVPAYRQLQARLGLKRCVVVTPSTYGTDNRCTVDAVRALDAAGTQARGIAVVHAGVDDATLRQLHQDGIRGVRFNQTLGGLSLDDLEPLAARIAPLGWHVELLLPADLWPAVGRRLQVLPVPVVLDHFGRLPYPMHRHAGQREILRLLEKGRTWVKLSGAYLQTGVTRTDWESDAAAMAADLVRTAPQRLVWGSNWPHPTSHAGLHQAPDDADLLTLLHAWAGDDATVRRILVDNPAQLYDFA